MSTRKKQPASLFAAWFEAQFGKPPSTPAQRLARRQKAAEAELDAKHWRFLVEADDAYAIRRDAALKAWIARETPTTFSAEKPVRPRPRPQNPRKARPQSGEKRGWAGSDCSNTPR